MAQAQLDVVVDQVRRVAAAAETSTDRQLIERFAREADQRAFAALVARHGPMVLAVCRRVVGHNSHDAEDAFQAAWLVLARKAPSVRWGDSVAGWLHEVAVRVAQKVRAQAAKRENKAREL